MNESVAGHGFSAVDRSTNPEYFVRYLEAVGAEPVMDWLEALIVRRLEIKPGGRYLDVGCGTGDDVRAMAVLVGASGNVIGIDNSEIMIHEAMRRSAAGSLPVEFRRADAAALDFADASFDGCRTERVLQHVSDPRAVVGEMVRVTKPGGRVVCLEPDWETLVVDAGDRKTTRAVLNFRCDSYASGWVGRQLPRLFKKAGLTDIQVELPAFVITDFGLADAIFELGPFARGAATAGRIPGGTVEVWLDALQRASMEGHFLAAFTPFLVSAGKAGMSSS